MHANKNHHVSSLSFSSASLLAINHLDFGFMPPPSPLLLLMPIGFHHQLVVFLKDSHAEDQLVAVVADSAAAAA